MGRLGGEVISHRADDEVLPGGVDDFLGDDGHVVDLEDAFDLADEADGEPEVSAGDAGDGGDGFDGGEVVGVAEAQVGPGSGEDEGLLVGGVRRRRTR
ncbi:hypothetical protein [Streptosporangium roseum]|uniref:hypothetical protein n=1 Tax=Streptosporangium roseum TaxID=2001 RepID=UPI0012DEA373|nr:hypothetical protein [Streptosporangium roseum]